MENQNQLSREALRFRCLKLAYFESIFGDVNVVERADELFNLVTKAALKEESKSSLENDRRSGRTTRIIDEAIQTLFREGEVTVRDHDTSFDKSHNAVFHQVLNRMEAEHPYVRLEFIRKSHCIKLAE